ncbi:hypothetical protein ABPG72_003640 [Tetrahymena utriculariae]
MIESVFIFFAEFQASNLLIKFFVVLGLYHILSYLVSIICFFARLAQSGLDLQARLGKNSWAIVTGASDGIGKQFCYSLSKRGFNVVLVVRNQEKTLPIVDDLKKKFPSVSYKIVVADFTNSLRDDAFFNNIVEKVKNLDVSILVNNVGIDLAAGEKYYHKLPVKKVIENIVVNTVPQALITRALITQLLNRSQRSAIIDICSFAGVTTIPMTEVYSATKAFNLHLSRSLNQEYRKKLDFLTLTPLVTQTQMTNSQIKQGALSGYISAEQFTESSLNLVGRVQYSNGNYIHSIQSAFASIIPEFLIDRISFKQMVKVKDAYNIEQNKNK